MDAVNVVRRLREVENMPAADVLLVVNVNDAVPVPDGIDIHGGVNMFLLQDGKYWALVTVLPTGEIVHVDKGVGDWRNSNVLGGVLCPASLKL